MQQDPWIKELFQAIEMQLDVARQSNDTITDSQLFDIAKEQTLVMYERELGIATDATKPEEERRSNIEARWKSSGKTDIQLLQGIADSWKNGTIDVKFADGKLIVKFAGIYGIPTDLNALKSAIEEVKPAHLPVIYEFLYHIWNDYITQTWQQISNKTWNEVRGGN